MKALIFIILVAVCGHSYANTYYMATTGSDGNSGGILTPFKTIEKLSSTLHAGDIGYIRGGIYYSAAGNGASAIFRVQGLTANSAAHILISAYPGELPIFDCYNIVPTTAYPYAFYFANNNYVDIKGHIIIRNLRQIADGSGISRGLVMSSDNNCKLEWIEVYNMASTGLSISTSNNNWILNCDFHHNGDGLTVNSNGSSDAWDNADGWSCTGGDVSTDNIIEGCRMWLNSDDGCDFFDWNGNLFTIKNCWSFWNGIKPWGPTNTSLDTSAMTPGNPALFFGTSASQRAYQSNGAAGEGFKAGGGSQTGHTTTLTKKYWNCLAFENVGSGYPGNALAANSGQYQYYNCAAYKNGRDGFGYAAGWATGIAHYFKNCWAWGNSQFNSIDKDWAYDGLSTNISNNVWMTIYNGINYGNFNPTIQASAGDFQNISSVGMDGSRKTDGSLPDVSYLHLAAGSDLINAGVNVGFPYNDAAPDMGPFEYASTTSVNIAPTANAGSDQNIILPVNSVTLSGSGTDPDGTIISYLWTKVSGPTAGTISNSTAAATSVTALIQGVYKFELKVTDNSGATDTDTLQVTVNAAANQAPTADAGSDLNITLPTNIVSFDGSGTDPDGTITAYLWTKVSGPVTGVITNPAASATTVTALTQGVYKFQLKVTDNSGATDTDTLQVTVNAAANQAPTADAGSDLNITLPTNIVSFDGSGTDPDGTIVSYLWTKVSGPTAGVITNPTASATTVTALTQGVYKFELKVTDNSGVTDTDTLQVTVNAAAVNLAPTANAGSDLNITLPTNSVGLSGSGTDPDGTITAYSWTKISGPAGSNIVNNTSAATSVTGLVQGVYKFQLKVTDNSGATDTDTIQVTVNAAVNLAPTSNAGSDLNITLPTNSVNLSGSGTDPDGTITAYSWTKISGPAGSNIVNNTSAATSVTGLVQGVYKFQLKVTDNSGATDTDTLQVTVNAAANQAPTADAGSDLNITLPTNSVSLSGSGTDPDGTITAYLWTKVSGPASGTISNLTAATTSVTALTQGVYKFELKVTDNSGATDTDTLQVTVNAAVNMAPTANAGSDLNITLPTNSVSLSGSGTDPDGTITTYSWTKISGPAGSNIVNTTSAITSVTGLVQGIYKFQLKVTDNSGATDTDTLQVTVNAAAVNLAPTANAGLDQNITLPTNIASLTGSGIDPDGTIVSYLWTKISGPTTGTITNSNAATTSAAGLVQGIYKFQLKVTDNSGATDTDTMQVTVNHAVNQVPVANAGSDQNITLPINIVVLNGSGTDPDGTIAAYLWTKISGPTTGTITNSNAATTSAAGLVQGIYKFQLKVTDNSGATDTDTMQVTVNPTPVNQLPTANAGSDLNITLPTNSVSLSGSGTDPDGTIAAYLWTKISGPTAGTITNSISATTSATGLVQGIYKFQLKVTDNNGATDTDTLQVTVNAAINLTPTANAGSDLNITLPTNSVTLSGSGTDPDGTITVYSWTKIAGPASSNIVNTTSATTSVTSLVQGVYKFQLKVIDNSGATDTDTMQVTVNTAAINLAPTAIAGSDMNITLPTNSINLSGSGTDPDGIITAYLWTKISGPATGTISNSTVAATSVTALTQGVYKFELKVTDNSGATDTDTLQVTVNAAAVNLTPTANAGSDLNITLPTNSINLSGSGTDPDGTIVSYLWTKVSGPIAGTISNSTAAATSVTALTQGVYKFELKVTDNSGATDTDTLQVTVNAAAVNLTPTANAGLDLNTTLPTSSVNLSGSGTDPDGTITAYSWTQISGPANSTITNASAATTSVTGLIEGVYSFQLKVTDNNGATDTDIMQVTVNAAPPPANIAPIANAGEDSSIYLPANSIALTGTGYDADGFITGYSWRIISGSSYILDNANIASTNLGELQQGIYEAELTVTDNNGATGRDTVKITVGATRLQGYNNDVIIMGNPVQNTLVTRITSTTLYRVIKLQLFDVRGTLLFTKDLKITQYDQLEQIDMSRFSKGDYILRVNFFNKAAVVKKIMKI